MGGTIVILKNVFRPEEMDACKQAILDWRKDVEEYNSDNLTTDKSWWRRDQNTPSITPHLFESFCFVFNEKHPNPNLLQVQVKFKVIKVLWNDLTAAFQAGSGNKGLERKFQPQVIHYPSGGGFFDWHGHDLEPQMIGLIVGMSKRGRDFDTGGTIFRDETGSLDTSGHHDIGDITLFRFDVEHSISAIDETKLLAWDSSGRWTMVLPII